MSKESKFLSFILRHSPEEIGLKLDEAGWARIDELLSLLKKANRRMSREQLGQLVAENNKKRFTISEDGRKIRAAQGHSFDVKLGLDAKEPPVQLYHGTARDSLDSIFANGVRPRGRHQVHLSMDEETATSVGTRHGKPIVLTVEAQRMHQDGFEFFQADNGVWLTDWVPSKYLGFGNVVRPSP